MAELAHSALSNNSPDSRGKSIADLSRSLKLCPRDRVISIEDHHDGGSKLDTTQICPHLHSVQFSGSLVIAMYVNMHDIVSRTHILKNRACNSMVTT